MKSKFAKILGIVLTTILVAGMIPFALPVSAGEQRWTDWEEGKLPSKDGLVIAPDVLLGGPLDQDSKDGAIYAYAKIKVTGGTEDRIIKTTNRGRSWEVLPYIIPTGQVVEIVCPKYPGFEDVVFFVTASTLYMSNDAGKNFVPLIAVPSTYKILSFDANWYAGDAPTYLGRWVGVFGLNSNTSSGTSLLYNSGVVAWESMGTGNIFYAYGTDSSGTDSFGEYDVLAVKMAPTFPVDKTVVAIGVDGTDAFLKTSYLGGTWDAVVPNIELSDPTLGGIHADAAKATAADITFPSSYSAKTNADLIFCLAEPNVGGVYKVHTYKIGNLPANDKKNEVKKISFRDADGDSAYINGIKNFTNLHMLGTTANGFLIAGTDDGKVFWSANPFAINTSGSSPGAVRAVFAESALPYSVNEIAWVLLDKNFFNNGIAYVLNVDGVSGSGIYGGFSISTDKAKTFAQRSLINDLITRIMDFAVATNGDIYLITTNGTDHFSYWRSLASEGNAWDRLQVLDWGAGLYIGYDRLALAPDYVDSGVLFRYSWAYNDADIVANYPGGQLDAALQRSSNKGGTFENANSDGSKMWAFLPVSATDWVVGTAGKIAKPKNDGTTDWWESIVDGTVRNLAKAPNGDLLAVTHNATTNRVVAYRSVASVAGNSDEAWTKALAEITVSGSPQAVIVAAENYSSNRTVYIGINGSGGTNRNGIYRRAIDAAASTSWIKLTNDGNDDNVSVVSLVAAVGVGNTAEGSGMVYGIGDYVYRVKGHASGSNPTRWEKMNSGTVPFDIGDSTKDVANIHNRIAVGKSAAGENILYATAGAKIYTYTDRLNVAGTLVGAVVKGLTADVTFDKFANQTNYTVVLSTKVYNTLWDLPSTLDTTSGKDHTVYVRTGNQTGVGQYTQSVTGLKPATKYNVYVWAHAPVSSFRFTTSITVATAPSSVIAHYNLSPGTGEGNLGNQPTFSWEPVAGQEDVITGYQFELSTKPILDNVAYGADSSVVFRKVLPSVDAHHVMLEAEGITLKWASNYYWRVRAIGYEGLSYSDWVHSTFRTPEESKAITFAPTVTVPQITIPQSTVTNINSIVVPTQPVPPITVIPPTADTPIYIWVIIGIGAILCIAVLVLIVRTRSRA